jgi:tripartite-type tricarboxylate transporter receptor subunit TctC
MSAFRFVVAIFFTSLAVLGSATTSAQNYPQKPVRIVTSGVGGAGDFASRLIGQAISPGLGQQVIVDNRASSFIPAEIVAQSPSDGYTLLLYGSVVWLAPFLWDNVRYDPVKDLAPITLAVTSPNVLVVHPSLPVKSVQDLVRLAKAKPGQLNYGIASPGSSGSLAAELLRSMAGLNMVRINYKGAGAMLTDVISGSVHLSFATASSATPHLKSGRLRALAVTSAQPSALFPGLPTVASAGLPGYESASTTGIFAPAGTPAPITTRLNQEIVKALNTAAVRDKFMGSGSEIVASAPEQLTALVKSDMTRLGKVIKDAGMKEN